MANDITNGATATHNGVAIGKIENISYKRGGKPVDVSALDDATVKYEDGAPDPEVTIRVRGPGTLAGGAKGNLVITWQGGSTTTITNAMVADIQIEGGFNTAINTTYTFKPAKST